MKKVMLIVAFVFSGVMFQRASAQVHFSLNIGSQPVWGPTGYDHVEYYYMPDIDAYYYVPTRQYIYMDRGRWVYAYNLPARYHYDVYNGYKVVINEPRPYLRDNVYRTRYAQYRGRHDQQMIRDSRDSRYFMIKEHPEHERWEREHHDNGHGHGYGHDRDRNHGRGHDHDRD